MISIGWLIGTIITALILLAAAGAYLFGHLLRPLPPDRDRQTWLERLETDDQQFTSWLLRGIAIGVTVLTLPIYVVAAWPPFDMRYHRYQTVTGTVEATNKRLLGDGNGGMSEKYVVQLVGNPQQYGCEDTRCSLIKPGERVELSCIRAWIYAGTDGYDCRFVSAGGRS